MKTYLTLLLLFICTLPGMANIRQPYLRHGLDQHDGLADLHVRSIYEDAHGYIWVVTNTGLNKFDGNRFVRYTKENSGLDTNELNCVLQDPKDPDKVWIGSREHGLFIYDYSTGKISPSNENLNNPSITALSITSDNNILVTHYYNSPDILNPQSKTVTPLIKGEATDFPGKIWCSAEDPKGKYLYLGHEFNGLTRVDLKTLKYETFRHNPADTSSLGGVSVYSILIRDNGDVWLGTDNGVSVFDPLSGRFSNHIENSPGLTPLRGTVKAIRGMKDGSIWAATDKGGITIFKPGMHSFSMIPYCQLLTVKTTLDYPSLSSSSPVALLEDSYGNRWIGYHRDGIDVLTSAGPYLHTNPPFTAKSGSSKRQPVWSVTATGNGDLWIGGENEIIRWNKEGMAVRSYLLPSESNERVPVLKIYNDSKGFLWLGTLFSGAFRLNPATGAFLSVKGIDREVRNLLHMPGLGLIAATHNGIYTIDSDGIAHYAEEINRQLPHRYVTNMTLLSDGTLWIGIFGQGVAIISRKGELLKMINQADGLPSNNVNDIKECSDGNIWIATRDGAAVCRLSDGEIIKTIRLNDGLHSSNFKAIEPDDSDRVWISAEDGIICYYPSTDSLATFTHINKSLLAAFMEGCSCRSDDGLLVFGSYNGVSVFNPTLPRADINSECPTRVTELIAHDSKTKDQNMEIIIPINDNKISIPYNLNTFTVRFGNPDIYMSLNSETIYNMKGVDKIWTLADDSNEAVYRNLKPGTYRFDICTRFFGEKWSEPRTLLTITITPPVYLTWWAKLIYTLLAALAIGLVLYFYRYKMNLEKNLAVERENSKNSQLLNEERMMFYTNVTHELRTPLSLIVGPIEDLVNDPDLRDEHRRKLHTIRTSSMRLLNLINGILEFRKTETQNRHLEVTHGNLANFVREIGLRFKELNNNRDINIVIDVAKMEDKEVYYDEEIITTILNNLLGNALKYTKKGLITISLYPLTQNNIDYFELVVSDTGEGIDSAELPHIFNRYYQGLHNKKVSGTGIGLAIVKNLVELHEATIEVKSEKEKGSTFIIRFVADNYYPEARHVDNTVSADESQQSLPAYDVTNQDRFTVLIVEDDKDVRDYIATSFADDFNVICAKNGEEGLRIVKENMPDIVVSDIMMPVMSGLELCDAIKSDPATNHIPVILLTAKDSLLDKEEGYISGADSYMTKPFSSKLLLSRINNILEARRRLSLRYLRADTPRVLTLKDAEERDTVKDDEQVDANATPEKELSQLDRNFLDKFKNVVENNIEIAEMDIPFLTDKMCMSHSTLYRKVKSITGLTPNEFIRKIKLSRAVQLMKDGKTDLNEISLMAGFNSLAYFRKVFKKEYGIAPSEYLQNK